MSLVKNYIIDTNVPLHDPNSLLSFQENAVLIPVAGAVRKSKNGIAGRTEWRCISFFATDGFSH